MCLSVYNAHQYVCVSECGVCVCVCVLVGMDVRVCVLVIFERILL